MNMDYLINHCIAPIMEGVDDFGQGLFAVGKLVPVPLFQP